MNVSQFARLFDVLIPCRDEFHYYVELLAQSPEFAQLPAIAEAFGALDRGLRAQGETTTECARNAVAKLVDVLSQTKAYARLCECEPHDEIEHLRLNAVRDHELMVSIDMVHANYSVLRSFDADDELPETWQEFCERYEVEYPLSASKRLRQIVFGHLSPERTQRHQRAFMAQVLNTLRHAGLDEARDLLSVSNDECVLSAGTDLAMSADMRQIFDSLSSAQLGLPLRRTVYRLERIGRRQYVQTVYEPTESDDELRESFRRLRGVPGSRFYLYFKRHIIQQPLERRDLYFRCDGHLAQWVLTGDAITIGGGDTTIEPGAVERDLMDHVILRCIVGSRAYGLAEDESDTDRRGIYLPPADLHWSLNGIPEQLVNATNEDCFWELQKFITLALKANPNTLECLYTPLVEHATPLARELLAMRDAFLSKRVYQTYSGYVRTQFNKLTARLDSGREVKWKHAMHLIRLLLAGIRTLREQTVPVSVAEHRERLLAIRRGEMPWPEVDAWRLTLGQEFDDAFSKTQLPIEPDFARANHLLIKARRSMIEH